MNDEVTAVESEQPSAASAGQLLTELREAAGVRIAVLAGNLKVPVAKLEALEAGNISAFPDTVFMRALASSVCRSLKVDPAPVLALMPSGEPARLKPDTSLNAALKGHVSAPQKGTSLEPKRSRAPIVMAVGLLLVATAVVAFWPAIGQFVGPLIAKDQGQQVDLAASTTPGHDNNTAQVGAVQSGSDASQPQPADAAASLPADAVVEKVQPQVVAEPAQGSGSAEGVATTPSVGSTAPAAGGLTTSAATSSVAADPVAKSAESAAVAVDTDAGATVLVLKATEESWIQVRKLGGPVVVEKIIKPGETLNVPDTPPYAVVIGRAHATEVLVRGQPFDLKAVARENVARFEVK